jgi:hypothetical protein
MKARLLVVGVLVLSGVGASADLLACGDKFLVVSRGTRYQRAGQAPHTASILVYLPASSSLPKAFERVSEKETKKAGYRFVNVSNTNELDQALKQGGWDLLLTDLADSQAIRGRITGASAPLLVPVAYQTTGTELAQAKKDYQKVLKGPIKTHAFLAALDDVLAFRAKLRTKIA